MVCSLPNPQLLPAFSVSSLFKYSIWFFILFYLGSISCDLFSYFTLFIFMYKQSLVLLFYLRSEFFQTFFQYFFSGGNLLFCCIIMLDFCFCGSAVSKQLHNLLFALLYLICLLRNPRLNFNQRLLCFIIFCRYIRLIFTCTLLFFTVTALIFCACLVSISTRMVLRRLS
mgnify:CR=1 FL=1